MQVAIADAKVIIHCRISAVIVRAFDLRRSLTSVRSWTFCPATLSSYTTLDLSQGPQALVSPRQPICVYWLDKRFQPKVVLRLIAFIVKSVLNTKQQSTPCFNPDN